MRDPEVLAVEVLEETRELTGMEVCDGAFCGTYSISSLILVLGMRRSAMTAGLGTPRVAVYPRRRLWLLPDAMPSEDVDLVM